MVAINFTFTNSDDGKVTIIQAEWIDSFCPVKLDDNLMPIINKDTGEFEREEDDLDYQTIRMSDAFFDRHADRLFAWNKEFDQIWIGEWEIYRSDYNIEDKMSYFTQSTDDFPRQVTYQVWTHRLFHLEESDKNDA